MAKKTDKIFFDVNILLESALMRKEKVKADKILHASAGQAYISALTVHLFVYFAGKDIALADLKCFLDDFIVLPMSGREITWAFEHIRDNDFEDALQLACAVHGGCTRFVTLDNALARRYSNLSGITVELL